MTKRKHKDHKPQAVPHRSLGATESIPSPSPRPVSANHSGVIELTQQNFAASIDGHPFAVIDIWAPSSALCRAFVPTFAAAAAR
ncbi:MAG TPA: hypothetical protein VGG82_11300, partial [Casimicrobiaceae bacterium]